jgi:hypothetical protein
VRAADPKAIVRAYRDLVVVDREDKHCGMVDDIELGQREDGHWELTALLVGPGAWSRRKPRWLTALLPGSKLVRVAAADVASVTSEVRLLKRADELGLAATELALLRWCGTKP